MINDILTLIQNRLAETQRTIRYMDENWGQLDYYNDNPPVQWPCVLLELQSASWRNQAKRVQDGELRITLTVADIKTANTSYRAPAMQKQTSAAIWILLSNIHKALHGWCPGAEFGTMARLSTQRVRREDGIRQFDVTYSCLCTDASAMETIYNIADEEVADTIFNTVPPVVHVEAKIAEAD